MDEVKQYVKSDGHSYVNLKDKKGKWCDLKVCELVWENFKGEIPSGYEVTHIDGNKQNNRLVNLKLSKINGSI